MADGRRGEHGGGLVGDACGETTSSVLRGEATSSGPRGGRRPPVGGGGAGWLGDLPSVEVEARSTEGRPGRLDPTEVRPGRLDPAEGRPRRRFRWRDGRGCGLRWRGGRGCELRWRGRPGRLDPAKGRPCRAGGGGGRTRQELEGVVPVGGCGEVGRVGGGRWRARWREDVGGALDGARQAAARGGGGGLSRPGEAAGGGADPWGCGRGRVGLTATWGTVSRRKGARCVRRRSTGARWWAGHDVDFGLWTVGVGAGKKVVRWGS